MYSPGTRQEAGTVGRASILRTKRLMPRINGSRATSTAKVIARLGSADLRAIADGLACIHPHTCSQSLHFELKSLHFELIGDIGPTDRPITRFKQSVGLPPKALI